MAVAPTPTPRERVLATILALCRVKTVGQLSPHDRRLVRDALAVVDQLSAAASAAPSTHASSPTPSHSDGSDTASDTASSASERSPSLHGFQSRLRQPTPARQFAARRHVPGTRKPAKAANATTAGAETAVPRKPSKLRAPKWLPREDPRAVAQQEPSAPAMGASKLRQPAIVVRPRAPSAPQRQSSFPLDPSSAFDASLIDCVSAQDFAEAAIDTAVEQLGQLLEWYAQVSGSALSVEVAPSDAQEPLRVTGEEAQQALLDVELSVKGVLEMSQELALAITRVWIGSPWLRARQRNIARHAAQVLAWIQRLTMVLDGCLEATFSDASGDEAAPPVWRASLQPQPCSSICKTIAEKRIKSPTKLSLVRAEYAVGAFIAELIGACAPSASENLLAKATPEDDAVKTQYKLMEALCAADKALDAVQTRCLQASEDCRGAQDLAVWQEALDDAHAFATHALRVGLVGCSQQICSLNDCDLASMEIRAAEDEFPAEDRLSIDDYYNLKHYIVTVHAAIGRANKKPADAKFACDVQEVLTSIVDELAVWADPRFDYETDARPYEQAANRDLIVWCLQVLKEISK